MEISDEYNKAMEEIFHLIGRNVFVFQQTELLLKAVLTGRFVGTASQLKKHLAERATNPDKRTLGQLIDPLVRHHLTPFGRDACPPINPKEITISMGVTFEHTPEERAVFRQQLQEITKERNDLIHTLLTRFKFDSVEGCLAVRDHLRRQHKQILPVKNRILKLVRVLDEMEPDVRKASQEMKRQLLEKKSREP